MAVIQFKRGTEADAESVVLAVGEPGYATDTGVFKIGDGVTVFSELPEIGSDDSLALGETSDTAYRGDRGKTAYDHSQETGNPHGTTANDVGTLDATEIANELSYITDTFVPAQLERMFKLTDGDFPEDTILMLDGDVDEETTSIFIKSGGLWTAIGIALATATDAADARSELGTGRVVNTDGAGSTIFIGATTPSSPVTGDIWLVTP